MSESMKTPISNIIDKYLGTLLILCGFSSLIWMGIPFLFGLSHYASEMSPDESDLELLKPLLWPMGPALFCWMVIWFLPGLYFVSSRVKAHLLVNRRAYMGLWLLAFLVLMFFLLEALEH